MIEWLCFWGEGGGKFSRLFIVNQRKVLVKNYFKIQTEKSFKQKARNLGRLFCSSVRDFRLAVFLCEDDYWSPELSKTERFILMYK